MEAQNRYGKYLALTERLVGMLVLASVLIWSIYHTAASLKDERGISINRHPAWSYILLAISCAVLLAFLIRHVVRAQTTSKATGLSLGQILFERDRLRLEGTNTPGRNRLWLFGVCLLSIALTLFCIFHPSHGVLFYTDDQQVFAPVLPVIALLGWRYVYQSFKFKHLD